MKYFILTILIFFLALTTTGFAVDEVTKKFCADATKYSNTDEARADLLKEVKLEAVNELFGEFIAASTAVENSIVTSDEIRLSSTGFVRIDDNANYSNGLGFAEVCIEINAYVTPEDKQKFELFPIDKHHCVTEPHMSVEQIKTYALEQAILTALIEYDRKLEQVNPETVLQLLQQVQYPEKYFVPDTETYCVQVTGRVSPIEVLALLSSYNSESSSTLTSFSNSSTSNSGSLTVSIFPDRASGNGAASYKVGEHFQVGITVNKPAYIYLFFFTNESAQQIFPNVLESNNYLPASGTYYFPPTQSPKYAFATGKTLGMQNVLAIASQAPISFGEFLNSVNINGATSYLANLETFDAEISQALKNIPNASLSKAVLNLQVFSQVFP